MRSMPTTQSRTSLDLVAEVLNIPKYTADKKNESMNSTFFACSLSFDLYCFCLDSHSPPQPWRFFLYAFLLQS